MSLDLAKDARRLRIGVFVAASILLSVLGLIAHQSHTPPWQRWQQAFRKLGPVSEKLSLGIIQQTDCAGEVNRCTTCHLGIEHERPGVENLRVVFGPHPKSDLPASHISKGCNVCHGGTPRALDEAQAHALPGTQIQDPRMTRPHIQASCARCHIPGDQPGQERLLRGAWLYLELGCGVCHPLTPGGRGGWDYGPELRSMGLRSLKYLKASLVDPAANFPQSTMPSFEASFKNNSDALEDMLIYLESLAIARFPAECSRRDRAAAWVDTGCKSCHGGTGGRAVGSFRHRCIYILERSEGLRCQRCHPANLPEPSRYSMGCTVLSQHRKNCWVCHDQPNTGGSR